MIVQQVPVEDLKNVACICRAVHEATADILRRHQALIREYHCLDIDVMWVGPHHHDAFGWDIDSYFPGPLFLCPCRSGAPKHCLGAPVLPLRGKY